MEQQLLAATSTAQNPRKLKIKAGAMAANRDHPI
jgi:hypothetical protein